MQKALKITGIIFGILLAISTLITLIVGCTALAAADQVAREMMKTDTTLTYETAKAAASASGIVCVVISVYTLLGTIFSFVLAAKGKDETPKKGSLIALGVLGILTGAEVPGVIAIVHAAKNGK